MSALAAVNKTAGLLLDDVPSSGPFRKLVFRFHDYEMQLIDNAGVGARTAGLLATLGEGLVNFQGAVADLALTRKKGTSAGLSDTWNGDFGLGSVVADSGATLASTEQDYIPTTATPAATAAATTAKGISTGTEAPKLIDGTTTAKNVYLNILVDDADQDVTGVPSSILVNGTVTFTYTILGDK